jgi:GntR family transcriptional regulator
MTVNELDADDPRAYIRLAALVRGQIASGNLKPGKPVPSITTLSQQYGHARQTCSKALRLLVDEELLFLVPGLGYYVTKGATSRSLGS